MIVCDTGPLVAAAVVGDVHHRPCVDLFAGLRLADRDLLVPAPVVSETGYMLATLAGPSHEAAFIRSLAAGDFKVVDLLRADYERIAEIIDQYADFRLGHADASVLAVAERLGIAEVATLDHRHFNAVRPRHVRALTLLP